MWLTLFKSKIHRATVTEADLQYQGSITIDEALMEAAGLLPHERVQVLNLQTGARLETYIITGARDSGVICLNGPAAHHFSPGDVAIIIAYVTLTPDEARDWQPTVVFVDADNHITRISRGEEPATRD